MSTALMWILIALLWGLCTAAFLLPIILLAVLVNRFAEGRKK